MSLDKLASYDFHTHTSADGEARHFYGVKDNCSRQLVFKGVCNVENEPRAWRCDHSSLSAVSRQDVEGARLRGVITVCVRESEIENKSA